MWDISQMFNGNWLWLYLLKLVDYELSALNTMIYFSSLKVLHYRCPQKSLSVLSILSLKPQPISLLNDAWLSKAGNLVH